MDNATGSLFHAVTETAPRIQPSTKKSVQAKAPTPKKTRRVKRGTALKRHPSRPPAKKRVVKSKPVRLHYLPDGPVGEIVGREDDLVRVKWENKEKTTLHNPNFLVSVEDQEK